MMMMSVFLFVLILESLSIVGSFRVLLFTAIPSHWQMLMDVGELMTSAGHEVHCLSYQRDISILKKYNFSLHLVKPNRSVDLPNEAEFFNRPYTIKGEMQKLSKSMKVFSDWCHLLLNNSDLYIRLYEQNFNLLFLDLLGNDICPLVLARKLNARVVGFWPHKFNLPISYYAGVSLLPSVNSIYRQCDEENDLRTFAGRLKNIINAVYVAQQWYSLYYKRTISNAASYLSSHLNADDIYDDIDLIFVNQDAITHCSQTLSNNIISVGGYHCRPPISLAKQVEDFIKRFRGGVVFVALGFEFSTMLALPNLHSVFQNAFVHFQTHGFLWKLGEIAVEKNNIYSSEELPEQDILGHSRAKLFVSSCDAHSVFNALFHGIPLLCIPVSLQEYSLALHIQKKGFGLILEKFNLTTDNLKSILQRLLNHKSFFNKARHLSVLFRDQPEAPGDRLIYWIEYIIRHKHADHLKPPHKAFSIIEFYLIDVFAFIVFILFLTVSVLSGLTVLVIKILCKKEHFPKHKED